MLSRLPARVDSTNLLTQALLNEQGVLNCEILTIQREPSPE